MWYCCLESKTIVQSLKPGILSCSICIFLPCNQMGVECFLCEFGVMDFSGWVPVFLLGLSSFYPPKIHCMVTFFSFFPMDMQYFRFGLLHDMRDHLVSYVCLAAWMFMLFSFEWPNFPYLAFFLVLNFL